MSKLHDGRRESSLLIDGQNDPISFFGEGDFIMAVFAVSFTISGDERYHELYSAGEKKVNFEAKNALLN